MKRKKVREIAKAQGLYNFPTSKNMALKYESGFIDGAEWRINSVWRNVNIEPSEKRVLIVIESDGRISQSNFMIGVDIWKDFVKDADIAKWCYKEDLLPNTED